MLNEMCAQGWVLVPVCRRTDTELAKATSSQLLASAWKHVLVDYDVAVLLEPSSLVAIHVHNTFAWYSTIVQRNKTLATARIARNGPPTYIFKKPTECLVDTSIAGVDAQYTGKIIITDDCVWSSPPSETSVLPDWLNTQRVPWEDQLDKTTTGKIRSTESNAALLLQNTAEWKDAVAYDSLIHQYVWNRTPPLEKYTNLPPKKGDLVLRAHAPLARAWLIDNCQVHTPPKMRSVLTRALCHPSVKTLNRLYDHITQLPRWDGVQRLDNWLTAYLGTPDNSYSRTVGSMWLRSAVARAVLPGCDAAYALVFIGDDRTQRSRITTTLGQHFALQWNLLDKRRCDLERQLYAQAAMQETAGRWIIELPDNTLFQHNPTPPLRGWFTRKADPMLRSVLDTTTPNHPRSYVLCASADALTHIANHRRNDYIWPVRCADINIKALAKDRDQLLAEALACVAQEKPEPWWPSPEQADELTTHWVAELDRELHEHL